MAQSNRGLVQGLVLFWTIANVVWGAVTAGDEERVSAAFIISAAINATFLLILCLDGYGRRGVRGSPPPQTASPIGAAGVRGPWKPTSKPIIEESSEHTEGEEFNPGQGIDTDDKENCCC